MHADMPTAIRARVSDSAIDRVTRFFNATEDDAFAELLQNARRSGATAFDVAVTPLRHGGLFVACTDNGPGIADPAVLLAFGESGWDETVAAAEDPAGIGVYALSRRGCAVASRPRMADGTGGPGWRVQLTPDTFLGRDEAPILPDDGAPCPHGTAVSFVSESSPERLEQALSEAARYCPIAVSFAGVELPRQPFTDGAAHIEPWNGVRFGVFNARYPAYGEPDLNFHGLTLRAAMPTVNDLHGRTWSVRADIESCPDLELVLPARKEPVETPFLEEMRDAARRAIFHAMEAAEKPVSVAFADNRAAAAAGIDLPVPEPRLRPWRPDIADSDDWRDAPAPVPVGAGDLIVAWDRDPPDQQAMYRAAERAGIDARLLEPDTRLEGYAWYDALARVTDMDTVIAAGSGSVTLDALRAARGPRGSANGAELPRAPDAIDIALRIAAADGTVTGETLPTDIVFAGEPSSYVRDIDPIVAAGSAVQPHELAVLMRRAYFSPSDDADSDSWETQRDRFDEDAMHAALRLLASEDEARRHTIAEAVRREIGWIVPRDRKVSIVYDGGAIDVEFTPSEKAA